MSLTIVVIELGAERGPHKHKCGFDPEYQPETQRLLGCGFVWEHLEGSHMCPACGRGPWCVVYDAPKLILPPGFESSNSSGETA